VKLGDVVRHLAINDRKLIEYALNPENPIGRHKALVFEQRLGFTKANSGQLRQQIETHALQAEASLQRTDQYGQHYRVDLEVVGAIGQQGTIRTGWVLPPESDTAQLVTVYVLRK
jgi:hypothetical protein